MINQLIQITMSKVKEKIGICIGCEEPSANLSPTGYCPECEEIRIERIIEQTSEEVVSKARRNNAQADMMNRMFAHFI